MDIGKKIKIGETDKPIRAPEISTPAPKRRLPAKETPVEQPATQS